VRNKVVVIVLLFVGSVLLSSCAAGLKLKGISEVPGQEVELDGVVYKPEGNGPFPAVVLLHRCGGVRDYDYAWAQRLKSWGYVALVLDTLTPRSIPNVCGSKQPISRIQRVMDAHSGKVYLAGLPFVDPKRIAVMGWSWGGSTTLSAIDAYYCGLLPEGNRDPFRAAVAFYPRCSSLDDLNAPLLILIGEQDDWTPAGLCSQAVPPEGKSQHEVALKIYPGAHHCFDCTGVRGQYFGHYLEYNHSVTSDSVEQVKGFLSKYLK
jgi:dienelactone hydrolase